MPLEKSRLGPATDRSIRRAERRLAAADPIMKRLIGAHGHCPLAAREYAPFHMLANSIISQQLSTRAAAAIKQRLAAVIPPPFAPERFLQLSPEQLHAAGLSQAKARYIAALAARVCEGRLVFDEIVAQDDETVIQALSECPGIGRWTAEMFLIFALKRLDVLAAGDAGLQRAASVLYGKQRRSKNLLPRVAQAWRPYRSVASWYLWKSLEPPDR
jgi:DNA-3-methyladenine glycosylase II